MDHRSRKMVARTQAKRGINEDYDNEDDEDVDGDEGNESQVSMASKKGGRRAAVRERRQLMTVQKGQGSQDVVLRRQRRQRRNRSK
jgi:hypothetical protein